MERKLVREDKNVIQSLKSNAIQLEANANKALDLFHSLQSFAKIENEKQAFAYIENPLDYFDKLMIEATKVKPLGTAPLNPATVADMYGVNRTGFMDACVMKIENRYLPIRIVSSQHNLLKFDNGKFSINETALEQSFEKYRTYADTPLKLEILEYWENFAKNLNEHLQKGFVNKLEIYKTALVLGLKSEGERFVVNYFDLAEKFRKMS